MKDDVTISLSMLSKEQKEAIEGYAQMYGFTVAGFMRFSTLRVIESELKPESNRLGTTPKPLDEVLVKKKKVADAREKAGFERSPPPQSNVARGIPSFGALRANA